MTDQRSSSRHAALVLVLVTLLWGLSFPLVKNWQDAAGGCPGGKLTASLTLVALRMVLAVAVLAVWQPRLLTSPGWRGHGLGVLLGSTFCVGFVLQVRGLADTSPALSGFLTGVASGLVPLLAWICFRTVISPLTLLGLAVGLAGAAVLGLDSQGDWRFGVGEGLTLLASVVFAVQILLLDRLGRVVTPDQLTVGFLGATGLLALAGIAGTTLPGDLTPWLSWTIAMVRDPWVLLDVGLMTVCSTVLAFHWMNVYQPRVSANRAALIYLLEPVFAALFSLAWGHDRLSLTLVLGGGLILGGNLLAELPGWWRERAARNATIHRQRSATGSNSANASSNSGNSAVR